METFIDAVIGQSVLRKVISSDLICSFSRTNILYIRLHDSSLLFFLKLKEFSQEKAHGNFAVCLLVSFLTCGCYNTRGFMSQAHRG